MANRTRVLRQLLKESLSREVGSSTSCQYRFLATAKYGVSVSPPAAVAACVSPRASASDNQNEEFRDNADRFKNAFKFGSKNVSGTDLQEMAQKVWQEVKDAVLPREEGLSVTRIRTDTTPINEAKFRGPTHLVKAKERETLLSRITNLFHKQFEGNVVYKRLRGLTDQGKEMAEEFKDRMEASDHPMVHKIQDYHESFTRDSEAAQVMREILKRDSDFNMANFLRSVKADVPVVVKAYLEGKEDVLRQHCTDELLERLMGLYRHSEAQGMFQDSTLLFVDDVEKLDTVFVESQPVVVVTFSCQQINCMRDKFGNVVEGKEDEIQQVYYAWALEQDEHGAFDPDGKLLPPRWQLREMMIRGLHPLL